MRELPPCEGTTTVPVPVAFEHFNARFRQGCYPSKLNEEAEQELVRIFNRTVRHAMEELHYKWELGEICTQWALARVEEIAQVAKYDSGGSSVITAAILKAASLKVICYWKPRCPGAIFCVLYLTEDLCP